MTSLSHRKPRGDPVRSTGFYKPAIKKKLNAVLVSLRDFVVCVGDACECVLFVCVRSYDGYCVCFVSDCCIYIYTCTISTCICLYHIYTSAKPKTERKDKVVNLYKCFRSHSQGYVRNKNKKPTVVTQDFKLK